MSLNGYRQVELERQRREELRLERVSREVAEIIATCEETLASVRDPTVQQFAASDLREVREELQAIRPQVAAAPDKARRQANKTRKRLHQAIAQAEAKSQNWSAEQAASKARLEEIRAIAAEANKSGFQNGDSTTSRLVETAGALHQQGRHEEAARTCDQAESAMDRAKEAAFDETVRREVVRGLLATLKGMGFVTEGPTIRRKAAEAGVVALVGKLPSGRMARFEVHLDGRMEFDFEGYQDRECGKDLEKVADILHEKCGLRVGPAQVTWKNPDRISRGAKSFPESGTRQGTC